MPNLASRIITSLAFGFCLILAFAAGAEPISTSSIEQGRTLAKELCQACHEFAGADQAGTVAPPFITMKQRYPKRDRLRAIIYDAQKALKPHTMMPPFGRHGLVDKEQTEQLINFLYSL
jgi:sulfur-oxidizing protein SoxX